MRRKSERTVKSSPQKKAETPSRRSSRRGKKSPEKSVNEDDSENSASEQASSESEAEEVVPPKRGRRTSRTIEKSSSTEEISTPKTRGRRKAPPKKGIETIEEDQQEQNEEALKDDASTNDENVAEQTEATTSANDASEPVQSEPIPNQADNASETKESEPAKEPAHAEDVGNEDSNENSNVEAKETSSPVKQAESHASNENHEAKQEPEAAKPTSPVKEKPRKSFLRRSEHVSESTEVAVTKTVDHAPSNAEKVTESESNDTQIPESPTKKPKKSIVAAHSWSDESPKPIAKHAQVNDEEKSSENNVDTSAKDSSVGEEASEKTVVKKTPIVRKRKWLSNKTSAPKVQEITISTDSLKGLISDVKPVPLSDIKLDSSPEMDHESDDVKVVSSTSLDYSRHSEERISESDDTPKITTTRKASITSEPDEQQPLSPPKTNPSNILFITNLVRPFTVLQLKSLLQRTGRISEDGFWIDKIKSKCYVKYETEE